MATDDMIEAKSVMATACTVAWRREWVMEVIKTMRPELAASGGEEDE